MSLRNRLINLIQSRLQDKWDKKRFFFQPKNDSWEKDPPDEAIHDDIGRQNRYTRGFVDQALAEDLALFDLKYPTTMEKVTCKRNALLKTYHPDHFEMDHEKKRTANAMIQIVNAAYTRIKKKLVVKN